jgi:preprotein translocase subunit SecG
MLCLALIVEAQNLMLLRKQKKTLGEEETNRIIEDSSKFMKRVITIFVVVLFVVFFVIMYFIMRGKDDKEKNPNFCECYKMQKELDKNFDSNKATEWEQKCNKGAMNLSPKEFDKAMSECN